jgi:hypothetical protein
MSGSVVWYDIAGPYVFTYAYGLHGAGSHAVYDHSVRLVAAVFNKLVACNGVRLTQAGRCGCGG